MNEAENIMANLSTLSPDKLKEAQARIAFLLGGQKAEPKVRDSEDKLLVHDQIGEVLKCLGDKNVLPYSVLRRLGYFKEFKVGAKSLVEYIDTYLLPKSKVERVRSVYMLLNLLANWLMGAGIPICHRTLCQQVTRIPEIVEEQFPGYRASGILPLIVKMDRARLTA